METASSQNYLFSQPTPRGSGLRAPPITFGDDPEPPNRTLPTYSVDLASQFNPRHYPGHPTMQIPSQIQAIGVSPSSRLIVNNDHGQDDEPPRPVLLEDLAHFERTSQLQQSTGSTMRKRKKKRVSQPESPYLISNSSTNKKPRPQVPKKYNEEDEFNVVNETIDEEPPVMMMFGEEDENGYYDMQSTELRSFDRRLTTNPGETSINNNLRIRSGERRQQNQEQQVFNSGLSHQQQRKLFITAGERQSFNAGVGSSQIPMMTYGTPSTVTGTTAHKIKVDNAALAGHSGAKQFSGGKISEHGAMFTKNARRQHHSLHQTQRSTMFKHGSSQKENEMNNAQQTHLKYGRIQGGNSSNNSRHVSPLQMYSTKQQSQNMLLQQSYNMYDNMILEYQKLMGGESQSNSQGAHQVTSNLESRRQKNNLVNNVMFANRLNPQASKNPLLMLPVRSRRGQQSSMHGGKEQLSILQQLTSVGIPLINNKGIESQTIESRHHQPPLPQNTLIYNHQPVGASSSTLDLPFSHSNNRSMGAFSTSNNNHPLQQRLSSQQKLNLIGAAGNGDGQMMSRFQSNSNMKVNRSTNLGILNSSSTRGKMPLNKIPSLESFKNQQQSRQKIIATSVNRQRVKNAIKTSTTAASGIQHSPSGAGISGKAGSRIDFRPQHNQYVMSPPNKSSQKSLQNLSLSQDKQSNTLSNKRNSVIEASRGSRVGGNLVNNSQNLKAGAPRLSLDKFKTTYKMNLKKNPLVAPPQTLVSKEQTLKQTNYLGLNNKSQAITSKDINASKQQATKKSIQESPLIKGRVLYKEPIVLEKQKIKRWRQTMQKNIENQKLNPTVDRLLRLEKAYVPQTDAKMAALTPGEALNKYFNLSPKRQREGQSNMSGLRQAKTTAQGSPVRGDLKKVEKHPKSSRRSGSKGGCSVHDSGEKNYENNLTRGDSVASSCKCTHYRKKGNYDTLSRDCGRSASEASFKGQSFKEMTGIYSQKHPRRNAALKSHRTSNGGGGYETLSSNRSRLSIRKSTKSRQRAAEQYTSDKILVREDESVGVITCPKCMKRMMKIDGIQDALKRSRRRKKRNNHLSNTEAFEANEFKEVIKHLTRKRCNSSQNVLMNKGINYRFSLKDLPKYSKRLSQKDIKPTRFSRSAMGKRVPTLNDRVRQLEHSQRRLKDQNKWEFLRNQCILQQSDWSKSNLYQQYLQYGRSVVKQGSNEISTSAGKIAADSVYSETELQYYIEFLRKMSMKKYREDITEQEMLHILQGHNIKSQSTLKWLMRLMGFDYYYERILFRYQQHEQDRNSEKINDPNTVHNVIKVMVRSLQMYETIDQILLIFSLLSKIDKLTSDAKKVTPKTVVVSPRNKKKVPPPPLELPVNTKQAELHLHIRLLAVTKQLLNNNKFLQKRFIFKGEDILTQSEKKVQELKIATNQHLLDDSLSSVSN